MAKQKQTTKRQAHLKNLKEAVKIARTGLFVSVALTAVKAFGGYVTNIVPLIGDAIGSFSDIIAASAIFVGLKLSQKKASGKFKYGYHRVETLISLFISIFILYAGYKIFIESLGRFFVSGITSAHSVGIIAAVISIFLSLFSFWIQKNTSEKINSNAMRASADDKRNDSLVSMGVLISVVADKFKIPYVEGVVGLLVSVLIIWSGVKYGKDAIFYLLDYWNEPEVTAHIRAILQKSKIVTNVKKIRLRHAGTYIFGEAFLAINPFTDSKDLRDEIHRLNHEVEKNVEHLGDLVLYIDPPKPTLVRVAIPISEENGLKSKIAENPQSPFRFFFVEIKNNAIRKFYAGSETFRADQISEITKFLSLKRANILISSMIRPLLYYNLRLKNIKVYPHFIEIKDVENTVKLLMLDL